MKWVKVLITAVITIILVILLNTPFGSIPAVGPLFNPVSGFWQSGKSQQAARSETLRHPELSKPVVVVYDDRLVPHIFAENDYDLYFAQGYVTARDRLWQMDFQTRAAAGRVSEIVGEDAVDYDLYQRRIGMVYGAQNMLDYYNEHPEMLALLEAYTDGVNRHIENLSPRHLPVEYKIMGFKPEKWTPLKSLLVQMNMSATLNGRTDAYQMSNTLERFGDAFIERFYPAFYDGVVPIIPEDTEWDFEPVDIPVSPHAIENTTSSVNLGIPESNPSIGSNSWAVDGSRTITGVPLLANDMHLSMTLPAIWYEVQLFNDNVNVYGVSLPGLPGVVVGFNEDIAWGFTNSGANVMDIYEITFKDETQSEYYHDGEWKPVTKSVETILVRGGEVIADTVFYTHHGPIHNRVEAESGMGRRFPAGHAVQWIAHKPSLEMKTFYMLNRAKNYYDYYESMKFFDGPAQNFTYADRHGNIALWHNGKFPVRYEGMGDFILDGSKPENDWNAFIPQDHKPHHKNPGRGFVSSANQHPVSPDYPYYLGRFFATSERGARINEVLEAGEQMSYLNMMMLHLDNINLQAREAIPVMTAHLDRETRGLHEPGLIDRLLNWNYSMDANSMEATLYHFWWNNFRNNVWNDLFENADTPLRRPSDTQTLKLLINEPDSEFFDKSSVGNIVKLPQLIAKAWNDTIEQLREHSEDPNDWQWWQFNNVRVPHIANIPGLGRTEIETSGTNIAVNATRGTHGPSWRMVVSLENEVRGWGVYPGGQSGNPASKNYDAFVDSWANGGFFPLHFYRSKEEALEHLIRGIQTMEVTP